VGFGSASREDIAGEGLAAPAWLLAVAGAGASLPQPESSHSHITNKTNRLVKIPPVFTGLSAAKRRLTSNLCNYSIETRFLPTWPCFINQAHPIPRN
jgi:hypothetical protein